MLALPMTGKMQNSCKVALENQYAKGMPTLATSATFSSDLVCVNGARLFDYLCSGPFRLTAHLCSGWVICGW